MRLFLDSADPSEITKASLLWPVDGVTTNPSLLARQPGDPQKVLKEIAGLISGPVMAEVIATDWEGMVKEGKVLAGLADNIVVKIPVTADGLRAVRKLSEDSIDTMLTLVFSSTQALLGARAGAAYICPFVGRLDDLGQIGTDLIDEITAIFENYSISTRVVVGSVRGPQHVIDSALSGAYAATVPFKIIDQMIHHPLTDIGIERFLADWAKADK